MATETTKVDDIYVADLHKEHTDQIYTAYETATMRDPKRWAVFTWFCANGLPPPVESEISDLLNRIENVRN